MLPLKRFYAPAHARFLNMTTVKIKRQAFQPDGLFRLQPYILAVILWALLSFSDHYYLRAAQDRSLSLFDRQFIMDVFKATGSVLGLTGYPLQGVFSLAGTLSAVILTCNDHEFCSNTPARYESKREK